MSTDVVLWYSLGVHHVVRPEEWPVAPVAYAGFSLKPVGFFDGNPALDVPAPLTTATVTADLRALVCCNPLS